MPGSDVFIVGGVAPDQVIDISLYPFPENWESYNHWMVGDLHLDWDGPEEGQGEFAPDENDPTEYPVSQCDIISVLRLLSEGHGYTRCLDN